MEILKKIQYLGLMRSETKADMFTSLNSPTGQVTAVKQVTIVVHCVTHGASHTKYPKYWRCIGYLHRGKYSKSSHTSTKWVWYTDKNRRWYYSNHKAWLGKQHLEQWREKKKRFSFSSTHMSKVGMGGTLLLRVHFETLLSNKQCDLITPQHCNHTEADTPIYATYDKATAYVRTVVRALIGH